MDQSTSLSHVKELLYLLGIILSTGMLSSYIAKILRLPDVVFLLFAGIILGVNGLNLIDIKVNSVLNQLILIFGSCYILFDGGASVRIQIIKKVWPTLLLISTFGVLITTFISAIAAQFFIGLPFIVALLLGSTIASTDPATLIPVFKQTKVPAKISQLVISESACNDAMAVILTMTLFKSKLYWFIAAIYCGHIGRRHSRLHICLHHFSSKIWFSPRIRTSCNFNDGSFSFLSR